MKPPAWDLLIRNAHLATMDGAGYGDTREGALAIADRRIAWLGSDRDLPRGMTAVAELDAGGRWMTPGLIDCHTHLVYAGNRANEFEMRLNGATYTEIARAGGGIVSTVKATRAATEESLINQASLRLAALINEGVTTIEIKSGYGLDVQNEAKMLRVARRLGDRNPVDVRTTFLGAHALPSEFASRPDEYIDSVCNDMLPAVAGEGLADAVDAFCDNIGFTLRQTRRVFEAPAEGHVEKPQPRVPLDSGALVGKVHRVATPFLDRHVADVCAFTDEDLRRAAPVAGSILFADVFVEVVEA